MKYDKMEECFNSLNDKVRYSIENSDLDSIFTTLSSIKGPTLICGVGGSAIVGTYLTKVLREKNHILTTFVYPRDLLYMDLNTYENVIAVSYSGNNIGVDVIYDLPLNKYLFTGNIRDNVTNIVYKMLPEMSYVSIAATIVPLTLITLYYRNDTSLIEEILSTQTNLTSSNDHFEILTGYETITASTLLESSLVESGMATCLVHEKYNYCHGRINITRVLDSDLIFFKMDNELEDEMYNTLKKYYRNILLIDRKYEDDIINDYYASVLSLKLIRNIANSKNYDISDMKELVDNDVLYRFNGKMK